MSSGCVNVERTFWRHKEAMAVVLCFATTSAGRYLTGGSRDADQRTSVQRA